MNNLYQHALRMILGVAFVLSFGFLQAQRPQIKAQNLPTAVKAESVTPGRILVKVKPSSLSLIQKKLSQLAVNNNAANFNTGILHLDAVGRQFKATRMLRAFPNAGRMETKQHKYGLDRWYILQLDHATEITAAVKSFGSVSEIETAQPVYVVKSMPSPITKITAAAIPKPMDAGDYVAPVNDPFYWVQWHYHNTAQFGGYTGADIDLEPAWKINAGKPNVIVDVVDEGVDYKHEDLAANMWANTAELNGQPGVDDDGNGYVDDIHGYNFGDNSSTIQPGDHGTHTSGTIAAVNNNGKGVCGIAGGTGVGDGARIMSSEIFGTNGADGASTAAAIVYGANNGAVISQNSWGYNTPGVYDQLVLDAIDYFTNEAGRDENGNQTGPMNGGVVIFAAGNDNINDLCYPGYYPTAIAVGATTVFDNKAAYSNFGDWVDIGAPGGGDAADGTSHQMVASTVANNSYGYMEGTSMATPHVSGVAALIVSQFGKMGFTNTDLKNRLFHSVRQFIAMDPQYNGLMGIGALDAGKALQTDKGIAPIAISDLNGISNAQNTIDLKWTAPADEDNTKAESYIIYYSKYPFDSAHRDTVNKIIIKKALMPGATETFVIGSLQPTTNYYINVSSKDLWGNESAVSNQIKVQTLEGPVTVLPVDTLLMNINVTTNPTGSTSFKLTNNGTGVMNWIGSAIPVSSNWAKQNGYDTLKLYDQDYISYYVGDDARVDFSAATRFDVTGKPFNLTHVSNFFQTSSITAPITIYVYKGGSDPSKGTLLLKQNQEGAITDYELNITKLNGMFLFQPGEWFWLVYQYDPYFGFAQGAEYDAPQSMENNFMASSDKGKTWSTFTSLIGPTRLAMSALSNEGYPGGFISLTPANGNLAGLSNTNIGVNANATTIRNGIYKYKLQVSSNDLNNPMPGVPMIVTVTGQKGTLTSKEGILDAKSVFIGKDGDASIMLYNAGLSTLKNFTFNADNDKFTLVSMPDSLNPGDSVKLTIRFTPTAAGLELTKIKINTNDGSLNLSGSGIGLLPPVMDLTGIPVQIVARVDSTGKNTFTISNKNGKYPLSYSMPEIAAIKKMKLKAKTAKGNDPSMDYAWIDSQEPDGPVYSWDDISSTGTEITKRLAADIKTSTLVPLGFRMKFYGDTISQVYVNSFGSLSLNYPEAMSVVSSSLPIPRDGITGTIAGLFVEYMFPVVNTNEHVFIKSTPGKLIVQYNDLEYFDGNWDAPGSYSYGKATFQIVLYSNGKIEYNYKSVNDTWAAQGYGLIGLESKDETKGVNIMSAEQNAVPFVPSDNTTVWFVPSAPKFITSITPLSGAVAVGDTINITVTASAAGLVDSTYLTSIALTTNDPLQEKMDLSVVFTVTGIQGMMQKTDTLAFGNVFKNGQSKMDAVFLNTGSKPVQLISTAFSNPAYTTDAVPVTVPALSELHIPVTFKPSAVTTYPGTLTVTTDDSVKAVFTVVLTGNGKAAGSMSYELTGGETNTLDIGQTLPANLKITNNGDGDLKFMVEHPQWLLINQDGQGVGNGLDSAHTYSVHKSMEGGTAAYEWIELGHGLGTPSVLMPGAIASQEIKLPFAFPYYGKNYQSLHIDYLGNVTLEHESGYPNVIAPTIPSPLMPNGVIATANIPLSPSYDWEAQKYLGNVFYYTDNEKMIVEFYGMYGNNYGNVGSITFETIFYKDGRIKMMYQSGETESNYTQTMLVGIENEDGTDGSLAYNQTLWYKNRGAIEFVPSVPYTLKPGESVDLPASWTTTSMVNGIYKDNLTIVSNDPVLGIVQIPLELNVNGSASVKTTDTVAFGKVVAYISQNNVQNTYNQPVSIKNDGKQTITISNIDFSNNTAFVLDELTAYPGLTFPITLAPGDELLYHITFTPVPSMTTVNEFVNVASDYPNAISIPISATVIEPPVVHTDSSVVHFNIQQSDSAVKYVTVENKGNGSLDYDLSVEYHRPGIAYSSIVPVKPITSNNPKSKVYALYGGGQKMQVLGNGSKLLDYPSGGFADSILAYEQGRENIDYLGTGKDETPLITASRLNGGEHGFYLSHVGDLYRTDNMFPATIKFKIRLGSNINNSTVIYEQSVAIQPDTSAAGNYLIAKLDSAILINAYEDFWIEWDYDFGMRFPQGMQFVSTTQLKTHSFYSRTSEADAFEELGLVADFYTAAYAQTDSSGGWLTITPVKGSVDVGQNQQLVLTAHGPMVTPPDQSAKLVIHSNDPVTPDANVSVFVHIDQAPVLSNHDTLRVNEMDTLYSLIPATDDGGEPFTVELKSADTAATVNNTDSGNYFVYRPDYDAAGVHLFGINLADNKGNKRSDTLIVLVTNTNRPPVVKKPMGNRTMSLQSPALRIGLDSVFMDPDGDLLKFAYAGSSSPKVNVFVDSLTGMMNLIPLDTGHIRLAFMSTDIYGASAYDTLNLYIKFNRIPVASDIPNIIIDKGTTRTLNLETWFNDEDVTDVLTYTATLDSAGFVSLDTRGSNLGITGLNAGNCLVTVTASDGYGGTVSKTFMVTVLNDKGNIIDDCHITVAPNPIHTTGNILYQVGGDKSVRIELVSMDGKLQSVLFDGKCSTGTHSLHVNFSNISDGNYLLKFTIGGKIGIIQIAKL